MSNTVPLGPGSRLGPYEIDSAIGAGGPACTNRRTLNLPGEGHLRWTPDGRGVAYIDGATQRNVWVQPLDGGTPHQLTHFTDRTIADFAWSRDATRLTIARATVTNDIVLFKGLR